LVGTKVVSKLIEVNTMRMLSGLWGKDY